MVEAGEMLALVERSCRTSRPPDLSFEDCVARSCAALEALDDGSSC
ncbi:MAG TPA: hypothetical protein VJ994_10570 [Paracoccaceae bacterium]|nr:hypothetical protein [Paracoccaceae bacterium]